mmetsp:Transcript_6509/g.19175  ORF Transcript_6509/g.19175 Transcript_6509/m.19175 type:complete len:297 (-) Transcript_6509:690-1580(-)
MTEWRAPRMPLRSSPAIGGSPRTIAPGLSGTWGRAPPWREGSGRTSRAPQQSAGTAAPRRPVGRPSPHFRCRCPAAAAPRRLPAAGPPRLAGCRGYPCRERGAMTRHNSARPSHTTWRTGTGRPGGCTSCGGSGRLPREPGAKSAGPPGRWSHRRPCVSYIPWRRRSPGSEALRRRGPLTPGCSADSGSGKAGASASPGVCPRGTRTEPPPPRGTSESSPPIPPRPCRASTRRPCPPAPRTVSRGSSPSGSVRAARLCARRNIPSTGVPRRPSARRGTGRTGAHPRGARTAPCTSE